MKATRLLRQKNTFAHTARGAAAWLRRLCHGLRRQPDAGKVESLAQEIIHQPVLRAWLLTAAGQPPRARRALLTHAAQAIVRDMPVVYVLQEMADERLHHAVVDELFRRGGLAPLPQGRRSGRAARVRLAELGDCLEAA